VDEMRKGIWNQKAYIDALSTMWLLYRDINEEECLLEDEDIYGEQTSTNG
jgi:hypothetical protein